MAIFILKNVFYIYMGINSCAGNYKQPITFEYKQTVKKGSNRIRAGTNSSLRAGQNHIAAPN